MQAVEILFTVGSVIGLSLTYNLSSHYASTIVRCFGLVSIQRTCVHTEEKYFDLFVSTIKVINYLIL